MWTCIHCKEPSDENICSCWNCGIDRDESPEQNKSTAKKQRTKSVESEFLECFKCCKCNHTDALVKRTATTEGGLVIHHSKFIAVSCENCGYTELFNLKVLEGKNCIGTIMDILFG